MNRRQLTIAAGALLLAAIPTVAAAQADPNTEPTTQASTGAGTAVATTRDLTESYTATGTLEYAPAISVTSPAEGTLLRVVAAGSSVGNGDVLAVIDTQPVVWLDGAVPAWRTIESGDEGDDVLQLETALTALGFNADGDVTVDDEYTSSTAAMVRDWQESLGTDATGKVALGTVVFGADRTRVASVAVAVGGAITSAAELLTIGSPVRGATLTADPAAAVTLTIGDTVPVSMPDQDDVDATITAITPGSESWTVAVAFGDQSALPDGIVDVELDWDNTIVAAALTIPSSSLLKLDDGRYVVDVVGTDGTVVRTPVTVGVAVGTRVTIVDGLAEGDTVIAL